jgi:adenylate cyclase
LRRSPESGILERVKDQLKARISALSSLSGLSGLKVQHSTFYRWAHVYLPLALTVALVVGRHHWSDPIHGTGYADLVIMHGFDDLVRAHPRPYEDAAVRVIDIDEPSMKRLKQWPWPRKTLARLVDRLSEAGAAAIVFDVVFPEPDRLGADQDASFAKAIKASGRVVLGVPLRHDVNDQRPQARVTIGDRGEVACKAKEFFGAIVNLPQFEKAAAGVGSITTGFETDGVVRRVPLLERIIPRGRLDCIEETEKITRVPLLSAEALRVAQGVPNYSVRGSKAEVKLSRDTRADEQQKEVDSNLDAFLEKASKENADRSNDFGISMIKIGSSKIPTDPVGRIWLYPTEDQPSRRISAWKILDKGFDPSTVEGRILFVGTSAEGLKDLRATALDAAAPGVEVHANVVEQAVLGKYLERPYWADGAEKLAMLFFGILITLLLSRFGAAVCLPIALAAGAVTYLLPSYAFEKHGYLFDRVFPTACVALIYMSSSIISYLKSEAERRQVKGAFSRYMSPALVEQLAKHPEKLRLGGETREMTWHFCDIRGFTTISEQFDPHGLVQFINRFLTPMTEIILKHQGVIDKYMGDCIMAFWNAPLDDKDHARHACQAALAMHAKLAELNAQWKAEAEAEGRKYIPIHIGTGLNTGACVVGNMGSDMRFDYSVLGDEVNLASRLEGQSKSYGVNIIIGPNTRAKVPEYAAVELDLIKVKGKTVPVHIYALLGDEALAQDASFKAHLEKHDRMLAAYRGRRFDEARALMEELEKGELPLQKLYHLYEERLDAFAAEAPSADWDGTFTATSK